MSRTGRWEWGGGEGNKGEQSWGQGRGQEGPGTGDRKNWERGKCDQNMENMNGSLSQGCLLNLLQRDFPPWFSTCGKCVKGENPVWGRMKNQEMGTREGTRTSGSRRGREAGSGEGTRGQGGDFGLGINGNRRRMG